MKIHKIAALYFGPLLFGVAFAASTSPATPTPDTPTHAPTTPASESAAQSSERPYFLKADLAETRCTQPKLLKCIGLDESTCKVAFIEAISVANEKAQEEDPGGDLNSTQNAWLQGTAFGVFMSQMQRKTGGKFVGCIRNP